MERILRSPNSEDWVTWNFFQIMLGQDPNGWWARMVGAARHRNTALSFNVDDRSLPIPRFWSQIPAPKEYEAQSRLRMRQSGKLKWESRANVQEPVEGRSEIDIALEHENFLAFIECKLRADISMITEYDPQRNQIIRNIDCLIESAGHRTPIFWMLVRDESPSRGYVQLMKNYNADPNVLINGLPHRDTETLKRVAQNLTILLWRDFEDLVCAPAASAEATAVKHELTRRILIRLELDNAS